LENGTRIQVSQFNKVHNRNARGKKPSLAIYALYIPSFPLMNITFEFISGKDHPLMKGVMFLMLPPLLEQGFLSCSFVITGPNWA
jgi:hypothetical protein